MEFIARTVTHPDAKISKEEAEKQLIAHPEFRPGTVVVGMTRQANRWVATLHEPKLAGDPPPFLDEPSDSGTPADESKPPSDEEAPDEAPDDESESSDDDAPKDEKKSEKAELNDVMDLVKQIAQAVGVPTPGDDPAGEGEGPGGPPHPEGLGPDGPDGPPGLEGGPPHDGPPPGGPAGDTKEIIHRKAPPGAVPIGAPAFASVKQPKVASFDLEEAVPEDFSIAAAVQEIEGLYGRFGYKVKRIAPARNESGQRVIRAKVSVR